MASLHEVAAKNTLEQIDQRFYCGCNAVDQDLGGVRAPDRRVTGRHVDAFHPVRAAGSAVDVGIRGTVPLTLAAAGARIDLLKKCLKGFIVVPNARIENAMTLFAGPMSIKT